MIDLSLPGAKSKLLKMLEEDAYDIQETVILYMKSHSEFYANKLREYTEKYLVKPKTGKINGLFEAITSCSPKDKYGRFQIHPDFKERFDIIQDYDNGRVGAMLSTVCECIRGHKLFEHNDINYMLGEGEFRD